MLIAVSFFAFRAPGGLIKKMSDSDDDPDRELMLKTMSIIKWLARFFAFGIISFGIILYTLGGGFN